MKYYWEVEEEEEENKPEPLKIIIKNITKTKFVHFTRHTHTQWWYELWNKRDTILPCTICHQTRTLPPHAVHRTAIENMKFNIWK